MELMTDNSTKMIHGVQMMSSKHIAEVLLKRHDTVKVSMERLASTGIIQLTPMTEVNHKGQTTVVYYVNERDSYIVVAQLSPEFTAVLVDTWKMMKEELEARTPACLPDFTNPVAAARAWADEVEQKEQLKAEKLQLTYELGEAKDDRRAFLR